MNKFLEHKKPSEVKGRLPPTSQGTARGNVKNALRSLKRAGSDPLQEPWIVDCDSSEGRAKWQDGISPCITVSRGAGHWVTNRGRRLTKEEMMRLQGMDPTTFKLAVSETQLGKQLGNTMSVNVLERLFARLLPAARLVRHGDVKDRWASGLAVRMLARTRGKTFKALSASAKKAIASKKAIANEEPTSRTGKRRVASSFAAAALKRSRKN